MRKKLSWDMLRKLLHGYNTIRKNSQKPELARLKDIYSGKFQFAELVSPNFISLLSKAVSKDKDSHYLDKMQRPLLYFPFLTAKPFHEKDENAELLERYADIIRKEFSAIDEFLYKKHPATLVKDGKWDTFTLFRNGVKHEANCALCPETTRIIEQLPHCCNWHGMAYFSVLQPGVHIPPHCSYTNGRLRYHLGLEVPEGVWIRVKDDVRYWISDKCLIFDDSFEHEVFHKGQTRRVALIVDLWHSDLSKEERKALEEIYIEFKT
ncbi:MAG: aspartyl/asparaginyl beta-hydroxylase domain-containing protein [Tolypothrix carrinoi HA7290-LM1]|jgi:aspartate beta-hydroxylase|nr:aspartyl/asparaginyl beta-hydroxylase domain-containing protein [Tolypothrix carrinoi HA7290-LM1]